MKKLTLLLFIFCFLFVAAKASPPARERVDETIELPGQIVNPGKAIDLSVGVDLPEKYKFTPGVPLSIRVKSDSGKEKWQKSVVEPAKNLPAQGKVGIDFSGSGELNVFLDIYFCEKKDQALCYFKTIKLVQPIEIREGISSSEIQIKYRVK